MEIFMNVTNAINNVFLVLCGVAFAVQIIYVLFFWLKTKKYPKAEKQNRFGIIIPARNERDVIGETVKNLRKQKYPAELFDVFVVADNCTDDTAEIARAAGAIVFERFDDDPKHKRASYALKHGFEQIFENYDNYDAFIKLDADNLVNDEYISRMNDAYESGVRIARGYSNSKNLTQNMWTGVSGLYYIRDSRIACHVREALHTDQMLTGAGMMVSAEILKKHGGWDAMGTSDDAEFTMKRLLEGEHTHYVPDAMVYEDQPATLKDTVNRNKRMGHGLNKLFFSKGILSFLKFFVTFRFAYLDMALTLLFIPIAVVACIWFPLFYGFNIIYAAVIGNTAFLIDIAKLIGIILVFAFYVPFTLQSLLAAGLDRKKLNIKSFKEILPAIFVSPLFMIVYAISITLGVLSKPKWKSVKRNVVATDLPTAELPAAELSATELSTTETAATQTEANE